jgi:hypothetical protein
MPPSNLESPLFHSSQPGAWPAAGNKYTRSVRLSSTRKDIDIRDTVPAGRPHRRRALTNDSCQLGRPRSSPRADDANRTTRVRGQRREHGSTGRQRFGAACGCQNFIYVKASHDTSAGLMLNGETYRGALGIAGEIGHTHLPDATSLAAAAIEDASRASYPSPK